MSAVDDWAELMENGSMRLRVLLCICIAIRNELDTLKDGHDIGLTPYVPGTAEFLDEHVTMVGIDGSVESDELSGGIDAATDDDIEISIMIRMAADGQDGIHALARADAVYRCIRKVLLGADLGQDLDDLTAADGTGQVQFTEITNTTGPYAAANTNGYSGLYRIDARALTNEVSA